MKGEKFTFSEQIKTHEHGAGLFLEYQDSDEGAEKLVVYVPYQNAHAMGCKAVVVPAKSAFRLLKPGQKPLQEDKHHRAWVHQMHDKWKNEQVKGFDLAERKEVM